MNLSDKCDTFDNESEKMIVRVREWEWKNERVRVWECECEWKNERMREWECECEWKNERMREWECECEWKNERMKEWECECEWKNERMREWECECEGLLTEILRVLEDKRDVVREENFRLRILWESIWFLWFVLRNRPELIHSAALVRQLDWTVRIQKQTNRECK
jgi:hypothetical protein